MMMSALLQENSIARLLAEIMIDQKKEHLLL
jgi:hypothetical protein